MPTHMFASSMVIFDAKVDQERTGFKALETEMDAITDAAMEAAERFLEGTHSSHQESTKKAS